MDENQRQTEIAKLTRQQAADDHSRHVEPEYAMRFMAGSNPRIQTLDSVQLDEMVVQGAAKQIKTHKEPILPDRNIETEPPIDLKALMAMVYDKTKDEAEIEQKWQKAIKRAKQQIKRPEDWPGCNK